MFDPHTQRWLVTWVNNGLSVTAGLCDMLGQTWLHLGRLAKENRL